ncbi:sugar phosphate isomerase/epimerase family protein [Mucilaginibacter ginkgonis]|uniref:Sugar phosphate isomerase/epimerase n=1 Tax=Mucilaginibacter ginkgonis TaxID=2682091 RepID=A0A6I4I064_9SPHI|nr:sugar phosphate isomerase/epimerase [Mucilaginibacter ginkgonis]QQL49579.1 sugar phosphate isomerase/epimerase [Mucilaginibacter ginkgonis]
MINRRNFLKQAGMLGAGTLVLPGAAKAFFAAPPHALGVQLFTLFNTIDADVAGSLAKLKAIGYTEIESAFSKKPNYYGMSPKEFAALCKSHGLSWRSHHVLGAPFKLPPGTKMPLDAQGKPLKITGLKNLKEDMQELVDQAAEGGIQYLVCANIPTASMAELHDAQEILHRTGEACKKAKLQLCYHNHDMEFVQVEGKLPYDMLLEVDASLLKMELDLAWATYAKVNVPELFKAHPGRFPLLHVKDIKADKTLEPVGEGMVPFKTIFAHAATGGVKHYFVEHDMPADAYASLSTSYKNLRAMGI